MKISVFNHTDADTMPIVKTLKKVFKNIKDKQKMQIIFITQEDIHHMNLKYREIDKPTDVLSFPNDDVLDKTLGDIFISIEQARLQATSYGHSFEREIGFLAVHGYLHLKGYDHDTPEAEKEMFELQETILQSAKLGRSS